MTEDLYVCKTKQQNKGIDKAKKEYNSLYIIKDG